MRTHLFVFLLAAGLVGSANISDAAVRTTTVYLDGLQETPPVATPATGTAMVTFNDVSGQMDVIGTFSSLIGTSNNAHVHGYAAVGDPASPVINLMFDFGVSSGSFSGSGSIPSGNIMDVLNGLTYLNIHSTFRPGGEIRGQIINFVPEPTTALLLALGTAGAFAVQRRRRAVI